MGKTVRNKPSKVETEEYVNITEDFYKLHKLVMIVSNIMFVNRNVFMKTSARKLNFVTVEHIPSRKSKQLSSSLNKVVKLHGRGGFIIHVILMEADFEKVAEILVKFGVKSVAARKTW